MKEAQKELVKESRMVVQKAPKKNVQWELAMESLMDNPTACTKVPWTLWASSKATTTGIQWGRCL